MRTADVAQRAGYSVQQIRNLERDGILPPAQRSATGYRRYTDAHVRAALAYRALAAGVGPVEAKRILRADDLLALLDEAHARLHAERRDLALAKEAVAAIAAEPINDPSPSDAMSISELADALGVRPSALRHWEAEGLVEPDRAGTSRAYTPGDVRDARIVHQLRLAGYRIPQIRAVLPQLRQSGDWQDMVAARDASIATRSRALLRAAAELDGMLASR
ncbi:MerR family transcriptional regulator [Actinoplanes sp. NPDC051633]|uniref:MerR family transcriptional regulator n=1 Tax=Actinoplanes sp. NPDC051633 TaxID=3155670 RepID=UPI0034340F4F